MGGVAVAVRHHLQGKSQLDFAMHMIVIKKRIHHEENEVGEPAEDESTDDNSQLGGCLTKADF